MLVGVVTLREPKMLRGSSCGGRRYRLFRSVIILSMSISQNSTTAKRYKSGARRTTVASVLS